MKITPSAVREINTTSNTAVFLYPLNILNFASQKQAFQTVKRNSKIGFDPPHPM